MQLTSASMAATFGLLSRAAGKKKPVSDTSGPPRRPPWSSLARTKTPIPFGYVYFRPLPGFFSLMNRDLGAFVTARGLCRIIYPATRLPPTRLPPPGCPALCGAQCTCGPFHPACAQAGGKTPRCPQCAQPAARYGRRHAGGGAEGDRGPGGCAR